jgi:hypothetical protein
VTGYTWPLSFYAIAEPWPGPAWQGLFSAKWPGYRHLYLREGSAARPDIETCRRMLATRLPDSHKQGVRVRRMRRTDAPRRFSTRFPTSS